MSKPRFEDLSDRGKATLSLFSMMKVETDHARFNGGLNFGMRESEPTPELRAGLRELIDKGWIRQIPTQQRITREMTHEAQRGGFQIAVPEQYVPVVNCMAAMSWMGTLSDEQRNSSEIRFPITQPRAGDWR